MGREERKHKERWDCPYCKNKGHKRGIYTPENTIGHVFIFITKDNQVDCHGPIHNTKFMKIVINYLKTVTKTYKITWWRRLLNKFRYKRGMATANRVGKIKGEGV